MLLQMKHHHRLRSGVKGRASHHLRKEFPDLKQLPALWTPTYFVASTGQVSTEVVKNYIENQRGK